MEDFLENKSINEYLEALGQIILKELKPYNFEDFKDFLEKILEIMQEICRNFTCPLIFDFGPKFCIIPKLP